MADLAAVTGINMGRGFAGRTGAVVAGDTTVGDRTVIHRRTIPGSGDVAGVAGCRCGNMGRADTDGDHPVMT